MICIKVQGNHAVVTQKPKFLTTGTVGLPVRFSFDECWAGLSKTAVFRCGGVTRDVTDVEEKTAVPFEVMAQEGFLEIGVCGTAADGSLVIPTVWAQADRVFPGAAMSGVLSADPPSPAWESLRQAVNTKLTAPDAALPGQLLSVRAVDESGKPTVWETVTPRDTAHPLMLDWGDPIVDLTTEEEIFRININSTDDGRLLKDLGISEVLVRYQMAGSSTATARFMPGIAWLGEVGGGMSVSFPCAVSDGERYPCFFYTVLPRESLLFQNQSIVMIDHTGKMSHCNCAPPKAFSSFCFQPGGSNQLLGVGTNIKIWAKGETK